MSLKREVENELQSDKDTKKINLEIEKYVSKNNGSICNILLNKKSN